MIQRCVRTPPEQCFLDIEYDEYDDYDEYVWCVACNCYLPIATVLEIRERPDWVQWRTKD